MEEKKLTGIRRRIKLLVFITLAMLFIGIPSVTAIYYTPQPMAINVESVGGSQEIMMFSPATGFLAVQNEHDSSEKAPYVVDTNLFQTTLTIDPTIGNPVLALTPVKISKYTGTTSSQAKYGIRNAYLNGVNYIFSNSNTGLSLDSFTLGMDSTGKNWEGYWGPRKDIGYSFIDMDKNNNFFRVVPNATGIYLISKQLSPSLIDILDISFISEDQLSGNSSVITPTFLYEFRNNAPSDPTFNPVPDTHLYDVMITNHTQSGHETLIGAVDVAGNISAWSIGQAGWNGKQVLSSSDVNSSFSTGVESVYFNTGCTEMDQDISGINNISVTAFKNTIPVSEGGDGYKRAYVNNLSTLSSSTWHKTLGYTGGESYFAGKNPLTTLPINLPITGSNDFWSFWLYGCLYSNSKDPYTDGHNFFINAMPSNRLINNPNLYNVSTSNSFTDFGNLVIPMGFVDGAPPFALNNYTCDNTLVKSSFNIKSDSGTGSKTTGSFKQVDTVGWGKEWKHPKVGLDVDYTRTASTTTTTDTHFTQTYNKGVDACNYEPYSNGFFMFLGPKMSTGEFNISDMSGNVPADPNTLFLTIYQDGANMTNDDYSYDLTNPDTSGWVAGIRSSPSIFDVQDEWDWNTWSGGWNGRDWQATNNGNPYRDKYTVYEGPDMEWDEGEHGDGSVEFTSTTGTSFSIDRDGSASAELFGFKGSSSFGYTQETEGSTTIAGGIYFDWLMKEVGEGCGISHIIVTPQILIPKPGATGLPWIPSTYSDFNPWFLTYDVSGVEEVCHSSDGTSSVHAIGTPKISVSAIPNGSGTIILPSGGIPVNTTGEIQAVPTEGYNFLYWEGKGIDIDDYSSPIANATVTSSDSTLRAYFTRQNQDLVETGMISIQNASTGNQVKIQGILPAGFNKYQAFNLKTPIKVIIGLLSFPFGPTAGNITVVSDHEFAYTTTDPNNGVSNLRVDLGTGKWWFTANQVKNLAGSGVNSYIVNIGLTAKDISSNSDVLMSGHEDISWSGKNEKISLNVFSLQNATMTGIVNYQNDKQDEDIIYLKDADIRLDSYSPTLPLTLYINKLKIGFGNATSVNGNIITYTSDGKDLDAKITVNNQTKVWDAVINGKRLSNNYWENGVYFALQIGSYKSTATIHPKESTSLKTPNIASDEENFLSNMNFGV